MGKLNAFAVEDIDYISVEIDIRDRPKILDEFLYFSVYFNCKRDTITAPVQEFMIVSYTLSDHANADIIIDDDIDVMMTCEGFEQYLGQKHKDLFVGDKIVFLV